MAARNALLKYMRVNVRPLQSPGGRQLRSVPLAADQAPLLRGSEGRCKKHKPLLLKKAHKLLNEILASIKDSSVSREEICTAYVNKLCTAGDLLATARLMQSLIKKHIFLSLQFEKRSICQSGPAAEASGIEVNKVTPDAHFQNDLGLESLDTLEIVMALEEEFGFEIPDNEAEKINCINLAVNFIASHPQAK
ncbi:acyl carrier protein 2 [Forsythia ovata]|uniref:Acyl carrier protein n=1 Tax=Forsythia ovata TaxID=205694 RepID=A0ABD1WHX7_9LAMI